MEMQKVAYGGILILVMVFSTGITWYIKDTGNNRVCSTGWILGGDGYYNCASRPDIKYLCYDIRDSSNTKNYWCDEGEKIFPPEKECSNINIVAYDVNGEVFYCDGIGKTANCISRNDIEMPFK